MRFENKSRKIVSLLLTVLMVLAFALPAAADETQPPPIFAGSVVTQGGDQVASGTVIAFVDGVQRDTYPVGTITNGKFQSFVINGDYATETGKPITFKVNVSGTQYDPVSVVDAGGKDIVWVQGIAGEYDLTITISDEVTPTIQVAGSASDGEVVMAEGNTTVSAENNTWVLEITKGTLKSEIADSDLIIGDLPTGLSATAAKGTEDDTIVVTVAGTASTEVTTEKDVKIVVKGSAVTEADAENSEPIGVILSPAPEAVLVVTVDELPSALYQGQMLTISASAEKDSVPEAITWQVSIGDQNWNVGPSATFSETWSPDPSELPIEKEYTLTIDTTPSGGETFTKVIKFVNYSIYVTGVSGGSASIENLGEAVNDCQVVFEFYNGNTPVGCYVSGKGTIEAGSSNVSYGSQTFGANKVRVSVVQFGSAEDPWDEWITLSGSPQPFSL